MIQLANDPNASRGSFRPEAQDGKAAGADARRGRPGHPWPFLSRHVGRPAPQDTQKPTNTDSGS